MKLEEKKKKSRTRDQRYHGHHVVHKLYMTIKLLKPVMCTSWMISILYNLYVIRISKFVKIELIELFVKKLLILVRLILCCIVLIYCHMTANIFS